MTRLLRKLVQHAGQVCQVHNSASHEGAVVKLGKASARKSSGAVMLQGLPRSDDGSFLRLALHLVISEVPVSLASGKGSVTSDV